MSAWEIRYTEKAKSDLDGFDASSRRQITKALEKVSGNPLPRREGGYGVELRASLSDCLKVKLKAAGIRIVYKLERTETAMRVIVIGMRAGAEVYREAERRLGRR